MISLKQFNLLSNIEGEVISGCDRSYIECSNEFKRLAGLKKKCINQVSADARNLISGKVDSFEHGQRPKIQPPSVVKPTQIHGEIFEKSLKRR